MALPSALVSKSLHRAFTAKAFPKVESPQNGEVSRMGSVSYEAMPIRGSRSSGWSWFRRVHEAVVFCWAPMVRSLGFRAPEGLWMLLLQIPPVFLFLLTRASPPFPGFPKPCVNVERAFRALHAASRHPLSTISWRDSGPTSTKPRNEAKRMRRELRGFERLSWPNGCEAPDRRPTAKQSQVSRPFQTLPSHLLTWSLWSCGLPGAPRWPCSTLIGG